MNPKFITQEKKKIVQFSWNLKDDVEQDDYDDDNSVIDHRSNWKGCFSKHIEDKLKKKTKRFPKNKSCSGIRPVRAHYLDQTKNFL